MKRILVAAALCASIAVPVIVLGQTSGPPGGMGPGGMGPGGWSSPSPALRAAMQKAQSDAKIAAFAALSADHATKVQAIVAQVTAGTLDRRAAATQIDGLLTADEQKAVIAAGTKERTDMRTAMTAAGMPPRPPMGGPPPGAAPPPPGSGPPPGRFGPPSAGRTLLMVSMAPREMRSTMPGPRSSSAP
jgi:hypothetical protein